MDRAEGHNGRKHFFDYRFRQPSTVTYFPLREVVRPVLLALQRLQERGWH